MSIAHPYSFLALRVVAISGFVLAVPWVAVKFDKNPPRSAFSLITWLFFQLILCIFFGLWAAIAVGFGVWEGVAYGAVVGVWLAVKVIEREPWKHFQ